MGTFEIVILLGGLAGGLVNGLTGFGTGLTALSFWLYAVPPIVAAPLVVICSIAGQLQTLPQIWHAISWRRVMPFIIGGLGGVPVGTYLLPHTPVDTFKILIGGFLIIYCGYMMLSGKTFKITVGGNIADGGIGFLGGVLGGIAGLSGALPSIWAGLRGWGKDERRAIFQAFNFSILSIALVSQTLSGLITREVGLVTLIALPGTFVGVWIGRRLYDRLGDRGFERIVYTMLLMAGIAMIALTVLPVH